MTVQRNHNSSGFTLLEVMFVLVLLSIIMGAIFLQVNTAQQRSGIEQQKLDMFQESREFMEQMTRDLRNTGYPNRRNYEPGATGDENRVARGLLYVSPGDVWFEGDVDGTGVVSLVKYHLDPSTTESCPCLRRSKVAKDAVTTDDFSVEVQYVQNGTLANPIFEFYDAHGSRIDLSAYTGSVISGVTAADKARLASIQTVKVQLSVQSKAPDLKTGQRPIMTLNSMVNLGNCSQTAPGGLISC